MRDFKHEPTTLRASGLHENPANTPKNWIPVEVCTLCDGTGFFRSTLLTDPRYDELIPCDCLEDREREP